MGLFLKAAKELVAAYRRAPGTEPLDFSHTDAYRQFVAAAEESGFTGSTIEMDEEFAQRRPEWVESASEEELRRFVHTLARCDRWNPECPTAVMDACRSGCMGALVERLED